MEYKLQIQDSFFSPLKLKPNAKLLRGLASKELCKEKAKFTLSLSKYYSETELIVFQQHSKGLPLGDTL